MASISELQERAAAASAARDALAVISEEAAPELRAALESNLAEARWQADEATRHVADAEMTAKADAVLQQGYAIERADELAAAQDVAGFGGEVRHPDRPPQGAINEESAKAEKPVTPEQKIGMEVISEHRVVEHHKDGSQTVYTLVASGERTALHLKETWYSRHYSAEDVAKNISEAKSERMQADLRQQEKLQAALAEAAQRKADRELRTVESFYQDGHEIRQPGYDSAADYIRNEKANAEFSRENPQVQAERVALERTRYIEGQNRTSEALDRGVEYRESEALERVTGTVHSVRDVAGQPHVIVETASNERVVVPTSSLSDYKHGDAIAVQAPEADHVMRTEQARANYIESRNMTAQAGVTPPYREVHPNEAIVGKVVATKTFDGERHVVVETRNAQGHAERVVVQGDIRNVGIGREVSIQADQHKQIVPPVLPEPARVTPDRGK